VIPGALQPARLERAVAWSCAFAPPVVVATIVAATRLTPGYSSISETLSQLAVDGRPHPRIVAAGLVVAALMLEGFAWALGRRLADRARGTRIAVLIAVAGVAVAAAAFIHDDPNVPHGPATASGAIHGGLASVAFGSLIVALFLFVRALRVEPVASRVAAYSMRIGVVCAVVGTIFEIQVVQSIEGLLQRVFVSLFIVWIEVVIFGYLLRGSASARPTA
jgi:drug/metabolite transporter (DMT)-like permease